MIGIILAIGAAIGAAAGLFQIGSGIGKRQEEIGVAIGKSINTLMIILGVVMVMMTLLFFMTRSRVTAKAGPVQAGIQGGGAPQTGGGGGGG